MLIATLGTEPQVVTTAFSLLRARGEGIHQVNVIHTVAPNTPIAASVLSLEETFGLCKISENVSLKCTPIVAQDGTPLADIETPQAGQAAFRALYREMRSAKRGGYRVHLLIAGGRKTMAIYGMVAAQLLFDDDDCLWHLHSSGDFLASKRMFPQPGDDVHLVGIPVILWSQVSPALGEFSDVDDPLAALDRYRSLRLQEKMGRARSFMLGSLTAAERRVATLLANEGLSDQEIAGRLSISHRTVEHHLHSAYMKAANHWELAEVNRTLLITLLHLYITLDASKIGETTDGRSDKKR